MKKFITLPIFFMLLAIMVYSQGMPEKFYYKKFTKSTKVYQTLSGPDSVRIEKTGKVKNRIITRKVVAAEKNYTYRFYKKYKKAEVSSDDGQVLGSYKINGKAKYDITLPNGTIYDWKKGKTGKEWNYSVEGAEVMNCKIIKEEGKKYLQYTILDPNAADFSKALLLSKVFGIDLIQAKASAPAVYGGVIAGSVAIALLGTMQQDSTPQVE